MAQKLGIHPRSAEDFFDALVALGCLRRDDNGVYSNMPESAQFLDKAKSSYIGGMLGMANSRLYEAWGHLTEGLRAGKPQNEARDNIGGETDLFEMLYNDPQRLRTFLEAMSGLSICAADAIAEKFPWGDYRTFIDIGCAQGGVPVQLAKRHPHLMGHGPEAADREEGVRCAPEGRRADRLRRHDRR